VIGSQVGEITRHVDPIAQAEQLVTTLTNLAFGKQSESLLVDPAHWRQGHLFLATQIAQAELIARDQGAVVTM